MITGTPEIRRRLTVTGVVQGVGFRPHVYRLATELGLCGSVGNDTTGVVIEVEGDEYALNRFARRLGAETPPLAVIESITVVEVPRTGDRGFRIAASVSKRGPTTLVPPDIGVCAECLADLRDPANRRFRYPFTNCTNCGPRFTIIETLPYDRPSTTMAGFEMCHECRSEYEDPADRRYHAQPIACAACGPQLRFEDSMSGEVPGNDAALVAAHYALAGGAIVAVKGIGGYHLACDARSDAAVTELRARKGRADKPFAVMVADLDTARQVASMGQVEKAALVSPAAPIVLAAARRDGPLSDLVAPANPLVGIMLPYTPVHHLLFAPVPGGAKAPPVALVMTSGNLVDEPICFDDGDARRRLINLADGFLSHDRPIRLPCDDSVIRVVGDRAQPVRRGRGYAPLPVSLPVEVAPTLAVGGELKNTFCVAAGRHAWVSQHIGDMGNIETLEVFGRGVDDLCAMVDVTPRRWAADAHPGYATTRWADEHATGPVLRVQHHHAHVAALMAEHGHDGTSPVIGFSFDGTGYGTGPRREAQIWGGEILVADYGGYHRAGHLRALPLPGGDSAVRNPCRVAVAYMAALGMDLGANVPSVAACSDVEIRLLARQVEANIACVPTTSMGRLFDTASSLLGVRHRITYEAQAAIELEALAADSRVDPLAPPWRFGLQADLVMDPEPVLRGLLSSAAAGADPADLAAYFHGSVALCVAEAATALRRHTGTHPVGLTGGVFQNALLTRLTTSALEGTGFQVLTHHLVPPNDGGLSLGQAVIAGYRRG